MPSLRAASWPLTLAGGIGDHVLDAPHHVRHLVANEIDLLDRLAFHAVGERRRQEEQTAVLPDMVLVADVEHAPALPAAVRALVSRADQRALAKHIGDDETLHFTQAVDGQ